MKDHVNERDLQDMCKNIQVSELIKYEEAAFMTASYVSLYDQCVYFLRLAAPPPPPPKVIAAPRRNPKSYQPPVLWTSYI